MPMKLRDGSYYLPFQSRHMILRDGKAVQSFQASIYNNLLHVPFVWNQKYRSAPPSPLSVQHDTISEEIPNDEVCPSRDGSGADYPQPPKHKEQPLSYVRSQKLSLPATFKSQSDIHQAGDLFANRWIDHSPKITQSSDEVFSAANPRRGGPRNVSMRRGCAKRCAPVMELSSPFTGENEKQRYFGLGYLMIIVASVFTFTTQKINHLAQSLRRVFQQIVFAASQFWFIGKQTAIFILVKFKFRSSLSKSRDLRRESTYGFRTVYKSLNIIIVLFPIAVAIIFLAGYHINSPHRNDITDLNLPNTVQMTITAQKENIKFWHVAPSDKHYQEETAIENLNDGQPIICLLYTSPSPRDRG